MARTTPTVRDTTLYSYDVYEDSDIELLDIVEDWGRWQDYLESVKTFRFISADGKAITCRKLLRAHYGDKEDMRPVWYAEKKAHRKVKRKYLGKNENIQPRRLAVAAKELYKKLKP